MKYKNSCRNSLLNLLETHPELAKELHPTMNGDLNVMDLKADSKVKVWWLHPYDDPVTGKHYDFVWSDTVTERVVDARCPYLTGKAVWPGYNDIQTKDAELASQWHPTLNGEMKASEISVSSDMSVWWLYPYDDPKTGAHYDYVWKASPSDRSRSRGCPYLNNQGARR